MEVGIHILISYNYIYECLRYSPIPFEREVFTMYALMKVLYMMHNRSKNVIPIHINNSVLQYS